MANARVKQPNRLTDKDKAETKKFWREFFPNISATAKAIGMSRQGLRRRITAMGLIDADGEYLPPDKWPVEKGFTGPVLATPMKPLEEIRQDAIKEFQRRKRAKDTRKWMAFRMHDNKPTALVFFGDPHLDECNMELLCRHVDLVSETEGAYGVGMGDYTNNWSNRLAQQIYPVQEITRVQGFQLAEWFFSAVPWFVLIKGNHDLWADKHGHGDPLDWMKRPSGSVLADWQARFRVVFPNKREFKVWAAHDFPGSSQYTKAFAAQKRGLYTGGLADLYITGHKHSWEILATEHEHTNRRYFAARTRGYKWHDPHADHLGYGGEEYGASLVFIMDPTAEEPRDKFMFDDVETGLDYLGFLRARR